MCGCIIVVMQHSMLAVLFVSVDYITYVTHRGKDEVMVLLYTTGPCSMGLVVTCKGNVGEDHMDCQRQNNLSPYWTTSLVLIILGMLGIVIVFTILIMALWKNRTEVGSVAKWISFFSSKQQELANNIVTHYVV